MRPDGSFNATAAQLQQHSSWHSPVPYLFGGLAAMLGLIAFALLILACSYWKLSGYFDSNGREGEQSDRESGEKPLESIKVCRELDEKIVVIMAGDQKPTFIATPMTSKASSFNDRKEEDEKSCDDCSCEKKQSDENQQYPQTQGGDNQ